MALNSEALLTQIFIYWLVLVCLLFHQPISLSKDSKSDNMDRPKKKINFLSIHWGSGFEILFFLHSFLLAKPQTNYYPPRGSALLVLELLTFKIFDSGLLPHSGPRAHSQVQNNLQRMMGWKYVPWLYAPYWAVGNTPCCRLDKCVSLQFQTGTMFPSCIACDRRRPLHVSLRTSWRKFISDWTEDSPGNVRMHCEGQC